jgi:hypothetical protein
MIIASGATMDPIQALIYVASSLAIGLYYLGIIFLGVPAWHATVSAGASKYISGAVTGIRGTLATFFGAVVGLNRAHSTLQQTNVAAVAQRVTDMSNLQIAAAWAYFVSLALALGLWAWNRFSDDTADAVRNLAITLPGVIAGILAVALNVQ